MSKTPIPRTIQAEVFQRDGYRCRYCGSTDGPFELDHVYPEARGGSTTTDNLVVSCKGCNRLKNDTVGTWPFPVGYFETHEAIPEGEERYWRLLRTACHEVGHAVSASKDALNRSIGDDDKQPFRRLVARIKSIQCDMTCIFPNIFQSIRLAITHQKPPLIDLVASQIALESIEKDVKCTYDNTWNFIQPHLIRVINSLNLASNLLYQAQLAIPLRNEPIKEE